MVSPLEILQKHWKYNGFRPMQEEIISSVMDNRDTIALLPTGGGKSICYQVPGLLREGLCIVISPLIALMKDQVDNLTSRGINASAVFSGISIRETDIILDNCIYGKTKFLYVAPERLENDLFKERLRKMKINLIAVDEAHCISQWGYDFRPAYLKISALRELVKAPVLALTATATQEVVKDIQEKLLFGDAAFFKTSFVRKNLSYSVFHEENKLQKLAHILSKVSGPGIVYVRNRRKTKEIAELLSAKGIKASYYHAGLDSGLRQQRQDEWMKNQVRVIVSTNAFGMGIDKPDVRTVVHLDIPDNPESYFQEAGRAGRDEKRAYTVLLYDQGDIADMKKRAEISFPEADEIRNVYQCLGNYYQLAAGSGENVSLDFDLAAFCRTYDLNPLMVNSALSVLSLEGYIGLTEGVYLPSRLKFLLENDNLYDYQVRNPAYDPFIKTILRSYEGVFDEFRKISETEISRRSNISMEKTLQYLKNLHKEQVLHYIPSSDSPKITFLIPRQDSKNLVLYTENLRKRRESYISGIKTMLEYVQNKNTCRNRFILHYFGEDETNNCGICDVCLGAPGDGEKESGMLRAAILSHLKAQSLSLKDLVGCLDAYEPETVIKIVRWMVDRGELKYRDGNHLVPVSRGES